MPVKLKSVLVFLICTLTIIVGILFFTRNIILKEAIEHYKARVESSYGINISYEQAYVKGWDQVSIEGLVISDSSKVALLKCNQIGLTTRYLSILKGDLRLDDLLLSGIDINLIHTKEKSNISFLLKEDDQKSDTLNEHLMNYPELFDKATSFFFDIIPHDIDLKNADLKITTDKIIIGFHLPAFSMQNDSMSGSIQFIEKEKKGIWKIAARMDRAVRSCNVSLMPLNKTTERIPGALHYPGMDLSSGNLFFHISKMKSEHGEFRITGKVKAENLIMFHWRISPRQVLFPFTSLDFLVNISETEFRLDSSSTAVLHKTEFHPYVSFHPGKEKKIGLKLLMPQTNSSDFFNSLPEGLFNTLRGIETKGTLSYYLDFELNTEEPDSLKFTSSLEGDNFNVIKSGEADLWKMNREFSHTVYEKGSPVRTFSVGKSNPNFTPLEDISEYLKSAVLTSEDGSFYYHHGFNEEAFRSSMVVNWKEKRFVRGGSTISMQLVKNIYLNRSKNVSRKIEEAMIVWLIENNKLVSKKRMFEVYLNIIEWGPGIYGIGEASKFYFNKRPLDLTIEESIYLAMIVPMPKKFKYYFTPQGNLKDHTASYFALIGKHLEKKHVISEEERINLIPNVDIVGKARGYLNIQSPDNLDAPSDSLLFDIF